MSTKFSPDLWYTPLKSCHWLALQMLWLKIMSLFLYLWTQNLEKTMILIEPLYWVCVQITIIVVLSAKSSCFCSGSRDMEVLKSQIWNSSITYVPQVWFARLLHPLVAKTKLLLSVLPFMFGVLEEYIHVWSPCNGSES